MSSSADKERQVDTPESDSIVSTYQGVDIRVDDISELFRHEDQILLNEVYSNDTNAVLRRAEVKSSSRREKGEHQDVYCAKIEVNPGLVEFLKWPTIWKQLKEELKEEQTLLKTVNKGYHVRFVEMGLSEADISIVGGDIVLQMSNVMQDENHMGQTKHELELFLKIFTSLEGQLRKLASMEPRKELSFNIRHSDNIPQKGTGEMPDGIYGMHSVRDDIADIILSHTNPEIMKEHGLNPVGSALSKGEPGVGKTALAEGIAERIGATLIVVTGGDIIAKHVGEPKDNLIAIMNEAKAAEGRVVLLLDELDGIVAGAGNEAVQTSINAELKKQLTDIEDNYPNILVLATVNNESTIDYSVIRPGRFGRELYIEMPNEEERLELISAELLKVPESKLVKEKEVLTTEDFELSKMATSPDEFKETINVVELAIISEGLSGAAIVEVFKRARTTKAMQAVRATEQTPLTQQDLIRAFNNYNR